MAIKSGTCFQDSVVPSHGLQNKPYTLIPTNQQAHLKKTTGKEMENLQSKASKDELKSLATGNTKVFFDCVAEGFRSNHCLAPAHPFLKVLPVKKR